MRLRKDFIKITKRKRVLLSDVINNTLTNMHPRRYLLSHQCQAEEPLPKFKAIQHGLLKTSIFSPDSPRQVLEGCEQGQLASPPLCPLSSAPCGHCGRGPGTQLPP